MLTFPPPPQQLQPPPPQLQQHPSPPQPRQQLLVTMTTLMMTMMRLHLMTVMLLPPLMILKVMMRMASQEHPPSLLSLLSVSSSWLVELPLSLVCTTRGNSHRVSTSKSKIWNKVWNINPTFATNFQMSIFPFLYSGHALWTKDKQVLSVSFYSSDNYSVHPLTCSAGHCVTGQPSPLLFYKNNPFQPDTTVISTFSVPGQTILWIF